MQNKNTKEIINSRAYNKTSIIKSNEFFSHRADYAICRLVYDKLNSVN